MQYAIHVPKHFDFKSEGVATSNKSQFVPCGSFSYIIYRRAKCSAAVLQCCQKGYIWLCLIPRAIVGGCGVIELLRFVVDAATRKFIIEVLVEKSS